MDRRTMLKGTVAGLGSLNIAFSDFGTAWARSATTRDPILVVFELSGGNDGLNTIVPFSNDAYYRLRPKIGIRRKHLLELDNDWGFNSGLVGLERLWRDNQLAIVHGCGYD